MGLINNLVQLAATSSVKKIPHGDVGIPGNNADTLLVDALNTVYYLVGAVAVIVIIVAGFMYITSSGDSGKIAKAKNMLTYAVIGIVVIFFAFAITNFIIGRVG